MIAINRIEIILTPPLKVRGGLGGVMKSQYGFTFIELILVLVVMSILAIVAMPKGYDALTTIPLETAAQRLKVDIRYAQNLATTTGESHGFRVTGATSYELYNADTGELVTSPYTQNPMQEEINDGTYLDGITFSSTDYVVEFDSYGRPTNGGGITIEISDNGVTRQIYISNTSGLVSLVN